MNELKYLLEELKQEEHEHTKRMDAIKIRIATHAKENHITQHEFDYFYWDSDCNLDLIGLAHKTMTPSPKHVIKKCNKCKCDVEMLVKSRVALVQISAKKYKAICDACKESEARNLQAKLNKVWVKEKKKPKPKFLIERDVESNKEYTEEELRFMPYDEFLKTAYWLRFRALAIKRASYKCDECKSKRNLHVHHLTYERRGCEAIDDVVVLCKHCHAKRHGKEGGKR